MSNAIVKCANCGKDVHLNFSHNCATIRTDNSQTLANAIAEIEWLKASEAGHLEMYSAELERTSELESQRDRLLAFCHKIFASCHDIDSITCLSEWELDELTLLIREIEGGQNGQ